MSKVEVEISHGKLRGVRQDGVNVFKGIPYAGRVSGDRRFRRPAELQPWPGVRDALDLGAPAIQPPRPNEPDPAEDCLFLNVWTPANDNQKRPVMFYNHGGGFVIGSGGTAGQDGTNLARHFDVVVVQTNHRLGLLGFLYLDELAGPDYAGSGNQGLLDFVASRNMAALWAGFARTGKPAAEGLPEWPAFTLEDRASMRIDTTCEVKHNRFGEELAMWRAIGRL
jgi:para-nitrobenzyl esterase